MGDPLNGAKSTDGQAAPRGPTNQVERLETEVGADLRAGDKNAVRSGIIKVPPEAGTTPHLENETGGGTDDAAVNPEDDTRTGPNQPVRRTERNARAELGPETTVRTGNLVDSAMDRQPTAEVQPDSRMPTEVGDNTKGRAAVTDAADSGLQGQRRERLRGKRRLRAKERTKQDAYKHQAHHKEPETGKTAPGENVAASREPRPDGTRPGKPPKRAPARKRGPRDPTELVAGGQRVPRPEPDLRREAEGRMGRRGRHRDREPHTAPVDPETPTVGIGTRAEGLRRDRGAGGQEPTKLEVTEGGNRRQRQSRKRMRGGNAR